MRGGGGVIFAFRVLNSEVISLLRLLIFSESKTLHFSRCIALKPNEGTTVQQRLQIIT